VFGKKCRNQGKTRKVEAHVKSIAVHQVACDQPPVLAGVEDCDPLVPQ
jgi:hypothetical protein